jgi:hypothetical protein
MYESWYPFHWHWQSTSIANVWAHLTTDNALCGVEISFSPALGETFVQGAEDLNVVC